MSEVTEFGHKITLSTAHNKITTILVELISNHMLVSVETHIMSKNILIPMLLLAIKAADSLTQ